MTITQAFSSPFVETITAGRSESDLQNLSRFQSRHADKKLIRLNQKHTKTCLILDTDSADSTDLQAPADAILTDRTDVILSVHTADCLPIILYHPSGVIGAIHAGRKGTESGILEQTLHSLKARWGVTQDVSLWFGPAICKDCYQIDRGLDLRYDLRAKNKVQAEHVFTNKSIEIIDSEHCTAHSNNDWFSYRKEGKGVQNNDSYICLVS
ncbi:polyphenol oxidase family protein [Candidatus Woesebacteria bacterium]|nr:polyphenol oxidase family protein [Candidatus Woesebacteria bacterium]